MTAQFITTQGEALALPGIYALEVDPPPPAPVIGLDWVGFIGRFSWGPVNSPYVVDGQADYLNTFAPGGLGMTSTGHRALARAKMARVKIVRVTGTSVATATMTLTDGAGTPVNCLTVTAKYPGALGGSISITIAAADDGVSGHFNLTATLGTLSETYRNLQTLSGTGGVVLGDQSRSLILAALANGGGTLTSSTRPVNGTYVLGVAATNVASPTAGADGTSTAAHYTGTIGTGNQGLALFEGDTDVTWVCADDCGNSLRDDVNTGLVAHAVAESRMCVIQCNSASTIATVITYLQTNSAAMRSERAVLAWPWVNVKDETGTIRLTPPAAFVAGAVSRQPRHLGLHWKDERNTSAYSGITSLEYTLGRANLILAQNGGIAALVKAGAYWAPKSDATTSLTTGRTKVARRRLADYVLALVSAGMEPYEGGPIDPATRSRQLAQASTALQPMVDAGRRGEAETTEAVATFSVATASSADELAAGLHKIRVLVKSYATQDSILFMVTVGPTVTIEEQSATGG